MDSVMVDINIPVEIHIDYSFLGDPYIQQVIPMQKVPLEIKTWLSFDVRSWFGRTDKEEEDMVSRCERTVMFEVEVFYKTLDDGTWKATDATLQNTGVPMYVKAYLENEAMKQVNESKEEVRHG